MYTYFIQFKANCRVLYFSVSEIVAAQLAILTNFSTFHCDDVV